MTTEITENPIISETYESHIIAFMDILGYSSAMLGDDIERRKKLLEWQEGTAQWKRDGHNIINEGNVQTRPILTQLSDTIVMSYPLSFVKTQNDFNPLRSLIFILFQHQLDFLIQGFLTRGAIVIGEIYNYANNAFGEGLALASQIEKTLGSYPVLGVDSGVVEQFPLQGIHAPYVEHIECCDLHYVDILYMLASGRSTTKSGIDGLPNQLREFKAVIEEWLPHSDEKIAAKWQKMAEIYNRSLVRIKELTAYSELDMAELEIS